MDNIKKSYFKNKPTNQEEIRNPNLLQESYFKNKPTNREGVRNPDLLKESYFKNKPTNQEGIRNPDLLKESYFKNKSTNRERSGNHGLLTELFSNKYFIIFLLFPYFKTSGFDSVPNLGTFCNGLILIEAIGLFLIAFISCRISAFSWALIVYELWDYVLAICFSGNKTPSLFYIAGAIGITLLFDIEFHSNFDIMLNALSWIFTAFVAVNLILLLLNPNGLAETENGAVYLFGIRTGFSLVIIPAIAFCVFRDSLQKRKYFSKQTVICLVCSIITLLLQWVATGIVELLIILCLYLVARHIHKAKFNIWLTFIGTGLLDYLIVYKRIQYIFSDFIINTLHKDVTLTGRTHIWNAVIYEINHSPVWGYGDISSVIVNDVQKACHNQWLYITHESGYVGLLLFIACILISFSIAHRYKHTNIYKLFVCMEAAILIATISEIQLYVPFFYALLSFPVQWKYSSGIEETTVPAFITVSFNRSQALIGYSKR